MIAREQIKVTSDIEMRRDRKRLELIFAQFSRKSTDNARSTIVGDKRCVVRERVEEDVTFVTRGANSGPQASAATLRPQE